MTAPVRPTLTLLTAGSCTHPERVTRRGGGRGAVAFPSLVALVEHPAHGVFLFDTGYTPRFAEQTARLPAALYARLTPVTCGPDDPAVVQLAARGIAAADVRTVVLSHVHGDHVAGARDFPTATFVHAADAFAHVTGRRALTRTRHGYLPGLLPVDLAARSRAVEDHPRTALGLGAFTWGHDLVGDGSVVAVPLPGHTPGHTGLLVRAAGADVLLVGDAAWSTRAITHLELPHPLVRLVTHRWSQYRETIHRLHRLMRDQPELLVVPSHCTVGIARARRALAADPASGGPVA